jgi:hypothetical protein
MACNASDALDDSGGRRYARRFPGHHPIYE